MGDDERLDGGAGPTTVSGHRCASDGRGQSTWSGRYVAVHRRHLRSVHRRAAGHRHRKWLSAGSAAGGRSARSSLTWPYSSPGTDSGPGSHGCRGARCAGGVFGRTLRHPRRRHFSTGRHVDVRRRAAGRVGAAGRIHRCVVGHIIGLLRLVRHLTDAVLSSAPSPWPAGCSPRPGARGPAPSGPVRRPVAPRWRNGVGLAL